MSEPIKPAEQTPPFDWMLAEAVAIRAIISFAVVVGVSWSEGMEILMASKLALKISLLYVFWKMKDRPKWRVSD
jgi:hypothetical protein